MRAPNATLKAASGRRKAREAWSKEAEKDAADGHGGHDGLQVRTGYAKRVEPVENANCAKIRK